MPVFFKDQSACPSEPKDLLMVCSFLGLGSINFMRAYLYRSVQSPSVQEF